MEGLKCIIYQKWDDDEKKVTSTMDNTVYEIIRFFPTHFIGIPTVYAILLDLDTGLLKKEVISNLKIKR